MEQTKEVLNKNALRCLKKYMLSRSFQNIKEQSPAYARGIEELTEADLEITTSKKLDRKFNYLYASEFPYYITANVNVGGKQKKILLGYLIRRELDEGYGEHYSCQVTYNPVNFVVRSLNSIGNFFTKAVGIQTIHRA
ncbi:MAG: hypothetical protein MJ228_04390 [Bacilli bacterium]|nr:hypothetical protein [Bacilli bacterium]